MIEIEAEFIVSTDIDNTLVRPAKFGESPDVVVINPYDDKEYSYIIHTEHVELLHQYFGRGLFIEAWSAGGMKHARSIINALGLKDVIGLVRTKSSKHMDDKKNITDIVGNRVFIPKEGFETE